MNLRNRLVGALVIVAVASILWSIIFQDSYREDPVTYTTMPAAPEFERFEVQQPQQPQSISRSTMTEQQPEPKTDAELATTTEPPPDQAEASNNETTTARPATDRDEQNILDEDGMPLAWVVQVASFAKLENAETLRQKLESEGFRAYTQRIKTADGSAVRVIVGPKLARKDAERIRVKIDKAFNLKTLVRRVEQG